MLPIRGFRRWGMISGRAIGATIALAAMLHTAPCLYAGGKGIICIASGQKIILPSYAADVSLRLRSARLNHLNDVQATTLNRLRDLMESLPGMHNAKAKNPLCSSPAWLSPAEKLQIVELTDQLSDQGLADLYSCAHKLRIPYLLNLLGYAIAKRLYVNPMRVNEHIDKLRLSKQLIVSYGLEDLNDKQLRHITEHYALLQQGLF